MFEVGSRSVSREFTIYKTAKPDVGYLIELDGVELAWDTSLAEAHKYIKKTARENKLAGAGVSEAFGRNRQFTISNRFAFKRFKGPDHD